MTDVARLVEMGLGALTFLAAEGRKLDFEVTDTLWFLSLIYS